MNKNLGFGGEGSKIYLLFKFLKAMQPRVQKNGKWANKNADK
jgi:hypothetical protein